MVPSDLNPAAEAGGDKEKALKNDEVFGCARSVHFRDLENHHSEYHPLNYNSVVQGVVELDSKFSDTVFIDFLAAILQHL